MDLSVIQSQKCPLNNIILGAYIVYFYIKSSWSRVFIVTTDLVVAKSYVESCGFCSKLC